MSVETVRQRVEDADRLVLLGVMQTDLRLDPRDASPALRRLGAALARA